VFYLPQHVARASPLDQLLLYGAAVVRDLLATKVRNRVVDPKSVHIAVARWQDFLFPWLVTPKLKIYSRFLPQGRSRAKPRYAGVGPFSTSARE
jgi:hypothetical protein